MSIRHGPPRRPGDLDPLEEPERWEALIRRIGDRAADHLTQRRESPGILDIVARWARPALATAASLLLLAAAGALTLEGPGSDAPTPGLTLAQSIVPPTFAAWITGVSEPTVTEMVLDLETLEGIER